LALSGDVLQAIVSRPTQKERLKCPKMTTVTVQALRKLRQKSWEGTPEEESLEATSGNRHRGCGRDMLGQTVPSTGSNNREDPITDGGQPCTTNIQRQ